MSSAGNTSSGNKPDYEASKNVRRLGQPCRAKNILAGRAVTDPSSGREWFVLTNTNEVTGMELIFIDLETGDSKAYKAPSGSGSWALLQVPGDRLVIGTYYDGMFLIFDLRNMEFVKTVPFPGEMYIWNLTIGNDGRVYGGTYNGAKLGALNLDNYTVEDCGGPAKPNMYLRNVCTTPDGIIFCNFDMEKPVNMLYDPVTKQFDPVPEQLAEVNPDRRQVDDPITACWDGCFIFGSRVFRGRAFEEVEPPFPVPPADKGPWWVISQLTTTDTLFLRQGNAYYRYNKGDGELTLFVDMDLRGGQFYAYGKNGKLLGVRGQDWFAVSPGDTEPVFKPIPVESGPRPVMFLKTDDRGRLWGGPHFGQTLFWMDLKSCKVENTGKICDAGGEVYDVVVKDGKVYAASYVGGEITYYDPEISWNQWNRINPRPLMEVGSRGYIRPVAGMRLGPDGKLYSGWMADYGTYGGALAITDPSSGETELIENPLGLQTVSGLEVDDRFIYVGSSLGANGLPVKSDDSPRLGIIDCLTKELIYSQIFENYTTVRSLGYDRRTNRLAMVLDWTVRLFDIRKRILLKDVYQTTSVSAALHDGMYYFGCEKSLMALDMESCETAAIAELPAKIDYVTVADDGTIYVSSEADVYAVTVDRQDCYSQEVFSNTI